MLGQTVIFMVEMSTGNLLGCSVPGQNLVGTPDPVTRTVRPIRADQVDTAVVRDLARAAMSVDAALGWARFSDGVEVNFHAGEYDAEVKQIGMPGAQWVLVVGTKSSVWMAEINSSIP
eukprot:RCo024886